MSNSLQPHKPQHTRPPCLSPTPRVHPNPCPLSRWYHRTISSSVIPFSSCPQFFPASGSFPMSQLFTSGGQSIRVSASTEKAREFQKNIYFCFIDYAKAFDCVDNNKLWKILKEMGIPDHLTWLPRNLFAGQEAIVRTGHIPSRLVQNWETISRLYIVTLLI